MYGRGTVGEWIIPTTEGIVIANKEIVLSDYQAFPEGHLDPLNKISHEGAAITVNGVHKRCGS